MSLEPSTVALSVYNAIVVLDRPATAEQIAQFLRLHWDQVSEAEIERGVLDLIARGKISADGDKYDTVIRVEGKRQMTRIRERELDGWF